MSISDFEAEKILQVAGSFYDSATQIESWDTAIGKLDALFDIQGTILEQHDIENRRLLEFEAVGLPSEALTEWADYYHAMCPRLEFLQHHPAGTIGFDFKILDAAAIKRHPLYQEFLRPYGTGYFLSATLEHDAECYTTVAMQRTVQQGHARQRDIDILGMLIGPMQHAFRLKRRLALDQQKLKDYESTFHELTTGIIILDTKGRIEFINRCADDIVIAGNQVSIRNRYLSFACQRTNRLLKTALARLLAESSFDGHDYVCLSRTSAEQLPLRVDILPVPKEARFTASLTKRWSPGRRLLVMLGDPERQRSPPEKLLRAFFGLTAMEVRLALALAEGTRVREYANQYGVSIATVRTHLASLRHKMGAKSQVDVVRLVSRVAQPLLD